jgi:hypothetical protein
MRKGFSGFLNLCIIIGLAVVTIILIGKGCAYEIKKYEAEYPTMSHGVADGYSTIVIDSCEYIEGFNRLAHKGNCRFCAERHRSGLKEIVEHNNNDNYDKDSI